MSVVDVSKNLGEYLLKGWVLTDEYCPNANCPVPLMRSPKGHVPVISFCVNCDGDPQNRQRVPSTSTQAQRNPSPSTISSGTRFSRCSTPPTEISSRPTSPTFALPVETAESVHRRQQSDAASAEIGARLLKGWAMLADECPNERCFGIPLVRPPLPGGKDPRKECVACGTVYIEEKDAAGWEHLVITEQGARTSTAAAGPSTGIAVTSVSMPIQDLEKGKGKTRVLSDHRENVAKPNVDNANVIASVSKSQASALEVSGASLELALRSLSQRLSSLASHPVIEPGAIASTAEAMSKVLQALAQVSKLRADSGS